MTKPAKPRKKRPTARRPIQLCVVGTDLISKDPATENTVAIAGIVQKFAALGDEVTFLWAPHPDWADKIDTREIESLRQELFEKYLINLVMLPASKELTPERGTRAKQSIALYHYLRDQQFDAIYFPLEGGLAYYSILAKETGVYAPAPRLHVIAQSPTAWSAEADKYFLYSVEQVTAAHMERYSAETCDALICTSQAVLSWMRQAGWNVSPHTDVIPPPRPYEWRLPAREDIDPPSNTKELIFCAGPRFHKGLLLLCDALDKLAGKVPGDLTITMTGKFEQILGEHTGGMVLRRAREWPFQVKFLPRVGPKECLAYARAKGALMVFPAYTSTTNLWVSTCIAEGLPFVATNTGSTPELLAQESHAACLCEPKAIALADKIAAVLTTGGPGIAASPELHKCDAAWADHLDAISVETPVTPSARARPDASDTPLVTVVLVHHDRPQYLLQSVKSVEQQDYDKVELIVVDDGSKRPETHATLDALEPMFKKRGWRILREGNKYLGAARNAGVRAARGDRILFLDDDNALFKSAVSTLVHAINSSGADIRAFRGCSMAKACPPTRKPATSNIRRLVDPWMSA